MANDLHRPPSKTVLGKTHAGSAGGPAAGDPAAGSPEAEEQLRRFETVISWVLRGGVVLAAVVVAVGLALMFVHHPTYARLAGGISYHELTDKTTRFPHTLSGLAHAIAEGRGEGIVVLGLFILLLTPVLRVAVGVLGFAVQRDPAMTAVTTFVLVVLVASFFLGGG